MSSIYCNDIPFYITFIVMTYLFIYVDIFIIVFYFPYYCNIRYVVLSFDEIKTLTIVIPAFKQSQLATQHVAPATIKLHENVARTTCMVFQTKCSTVFI